MTALSTIISIIAGGIIAYLIAKWQMKKNSIIHFFINSFDIGKGLNKEFSALKLLYNDEILSNNVRVLKGGFMNIGKNDIDALNGDSDIKLVFPEECIVKACKVLPTRNNLIIKTTIDNEKRNTVHFGIKDVFISDEFFEYSTIVEVPENLDDLDNKLTFQHRIKNTAGIINTYVGPVSKSSKGKKYLGLISIVFGIIWLFPMIFSYLFPELQYKVLNNETNKAVTVCISPQSKIYVDEHTSIPVLFGEEISSKELETNYRINPMTTYNDYSLPLFTSTGCYIILVIVMLLTYLRYFGKSGHVIDVLKKYNKKRPD